MLSCTWQWRNFLGLSGVVVGALIPVLLRHYWKQELADAVEEVAAAADEDEGREGPPLAGQMAQRPLERSGREENAVGSGEGRHSNSVLVSMEEDSDNEVSEQARTHHVSGDGAPGRAAEQVRLVWSPLSWWRARQTGRIRL